MKPMQMKNCPDCHSEDVKVLPGNWNWCRMCGTIAVYVSADINQWVCETPRFVLDRRGVPGPQKESAS